MHLAGHGDVTDHSSPWFQDVAFVVHSAAASAGKYEFVLGRITEIQVDLDAAKRIRNFVDDPWNQFIDVESGGNAAI